MRIPAIRGIIHRRILANYRVDPAVLQAMLPEPFQPKLTHGLGVAGVCLIRLQDIRPRALPASVGVASENAAHRIAVEWEERGETREGVYIVRRDSSSWFNTLTGGRLFPGVHHHARFDTVERGDYVRVAMHSDDGATRVVVAGHVASALPDGSLFESLDAASAFFERGALGYSPAGRPGRLDGLELRTLNWQVEPLAVAKVESSFFEALPRAAWEFDCALLMRHVDHEWHAREELCVPVGA